MEEQQLENLAKRLGRRAAEGLDVEGTARAVLRRVKEQPVRVVWWRRAPVLQGLAAAAVVVLTAGILVTGQLMRQTGGAAEMPAPAELAALSVDELEEVFDSLSVDAPVFEMADAGLFDLTETELEQLLELLEG